MGCRCMCVCFGMYVYMYILYGHFISLVRVVASDSLRSTSRSTRGVVASKAHNAVYCTMDRTHSHTVSVRDLLYPHLSSIVKCARRGRAGNQKHPRERRVSRAGLSISVGLVGPVAKSFDGTLPIAVTIDWCFGYMVVRFAHDMFRSHSHV